MFIFQFFYNSDDEHPRYEAKGEKIDEAKKKIENALRKTEKDMDWNDFDEIRVKES